MSDNPKCSILCLGAGQHVGRSAFLITFENGIRILIDCGIQTTSQSFKDQFPNLLGLFQKKNIDLQNIDNKQLPLFKHTESCCVDLVLITHYHLDHVGALPHFTEIFGYRGDTLMTALTKEQSIVSLLDCWKNHSFTQEDSLSMSCDSKYRSISSPQDFIPNDPSSKMSDYHYTVNREMINRCMHRVKLIDYFEPYYFKDLVITALPAGHVLGASMFHIYSKQSNFSLLYTGDFTLNISETFYYGVQVNSLRADVVISESTYASQIREPNYENEQELCSVVRSTITAKGNVLIPVSSTGKAQEVAALLCSEWIRYNMKSLIYVNEGVISKIFKIFCQADEKNFKYKWQQAQRFIRILDVQSFLQQFNTSDSVVFICVPRSLDSGPSRQLFESWCENEKNLILLLGFALPKTTASNLLKGVREFSTNIRRYNLPISSQKTSFLPIKKSSIELQTLNNNLLQKNNTKCQEKPLLQSFVTNTDYNNIIKNIRVRAKVRYIPIGSHADTFELQSLFKQLSPSVSILVHGEQHGMLHLAGRLRQLLQKTVYTPVDNELIILNHNLFVQFSLIREPNKTMKTTLRQLLQIVSQESKIESQNKLSAVQNISEEGELVTEFYENQDINCDYNLTEIVKKYTPQLMALDNLVHLTIALQKLQQPVSKKSRKRKEKMHKNKLHNIKVQSYKYTIPSQNQCELLKPKEIILDCSSEGEIF